MATHRSTTNVFYPSCPTLRKFGLRSDVCKGLALYRKKPVLMGRTASLDVPQITQFHPDLGISGCNRCLLAESTLKKFLLCNKSFVESCPHFSSGRHHIMDTSTSCLHQFFICMPHSKLHTSPMHLTKTHLNQKPLRYPHAATLEPVK